MFNFNGLISSGNEVVFLLILLWTIFWKGIALWHSARRTDKIWFMVLLILNTMGIAEIIYLFAIAKVKPRELFKLKKQK